MLKGKLQFTVVVLTGLLVNGAAAGQARQAGREAAKPGAATVRFDSVRSFIRQKMREHRLPSVSVAVAKDGAVIWEEAFGWANRERMIPATPHTLYSLASISKPITATAIMTLVEQGKLELDRPANDYLGAVKLVTGRGDLGAATVRQILAHIAGLPLHYHFYYQNDNPHVLSMDEVIARYGVLMNPPGEAYQYSNLGYGILDYIISRVSRLDYDDYLRTEIFLPLGMSRASVHIGPGLEEFSAVRYDERLRPIPFYDFDHRGGSAVYASAHDLLRFGMFHLKTYPEGQEPILKPTSIDEMQKPVRPRMPMRGAYALGWGIDEDDHGHYKVAHTGGMPGVRTILNLYPKERLAIVVLTNKSSEAVVEIAQQIAAAVLPIYAASLRAGGKKPPEDSPFTATPELSGEWSGMVRTWDRSVPFTMVVQQDGDIHVKMGDGLTTLLNNVVFRDGNLIGRFTGTMPTPDTRGRPHSILLNLRLRDGRLSGQASAQTTDPPVYFALTSFVELSRAAAQQAIHRSE